MKNYILITDNSVSFDMILNKLSSKFECKKVMQDRLLIKDKKNHAFLDYDDDMKNDYDEEDEINIRNSDCHFYSLMYHSEEFARSIIAQLSDLPIRVDNDEETIVSIKSFLGENETLFDI